MVEDQKIGSMRPEAGIIFQDSPSMTCFSEPDPSSSRFYVAFKTVLQARAECPNHVPF